jgi:hypothetical protein
MTQLSLNVGNLYHSSLIISTGQYYIIVVAGNYCLLIAIIHIVGLKFKCMAIDGVKDHCLPLFK